MWAGLHCFRRYSNMAAVKNRAVKCLIKYHWVCLQERACCIPEIHKNIEKPFQIVCILQIILCFSEIQILFPAINKLNGYLIKHFPALFLTAAILPYPTLVSMSDKKSLIITLVVVHTLLLSIVKFSYAKFIQTEWNCPRDGLILLQGKWDLWGTRIA